MKVVFSHMSSRALVAARVAFFFSWCKKYSRNTAVSCARSSTSGPEEQLCGLNHQSTDGDESTHSAASRQTPEFVELHLHIRCWKNFLCLNWSGHLKCVWILFHKSNIMKASRITCEAAIGNRFIWNRASRCWISSSAFFCFHKGKLLGIN